MSALYLGKSCPSSYKGNYIQLKHIHEKIFIKFCQLKNQIDVFHDDNINKCYWCPIVQWLDIDLSSVYSHKCVK